jgi:hypothetical protein
VESDENAFPTSNAKEVSKEWFTRDLESERSSARRDPGEMEKQTKNDGYLHQL